MSFGVFGMRSSSTADRKVSKQVKATENVLTLNYSCKVHITTDKFGSVEGKAEEYLLMILSPD